MWNKREYNSDECIIIVIIIILCFVHDALWQLWRFGVLVFAPELSFEIMAKNFDFFGS